MSKIYIESEPGQLFGILCPSVDEFFKYWMIDDENYLMNQYHMITDIFCT